MHFQITALQAVMAHLLGGGTIHHACGIPAIKRGEEKGEDVKLQYETAKRVLQWRWLFIDEISMVSARLLAEVDAKLRGVIRDVGTTKLGEGGVPRPFGGLNVVLSGDFWQLAPPDGGFLADVPTERISAARKYTSLPPVLHGQSLLWGGAECGVQGVTELEECERCDDAWLKEVQEEFRTGALTANAHAFLHSRDTTVTGSWLHGDVECGNRACRELRWRRECRGGGCGTTTKTPSDAEGDPPAGVPGLQGGTCAAPAGGGWPRRPASAVGEVPHRSGGVSEQRRQI